MNNSSSFWLRLTNRTLNKDPSSNASGMRTPLATSAGGTSVLTVINVALRVYIASSACGETLMDTGAVAVNAPSDTWMVAVQSPKRKLLAFSTSPSTMTLILCGFEPPLSAIVVPFSKTILGGAVKSCSPMAVLVSLTDNVNMSPLGSVISNAKPTSTGPRASSSIRAMLASSPTCPMTGGSVVSMVTTI